jgi:hypothetical protein
LRRRYCAALSSLRNAAKIHYRFGCRTDRDFSGRYRGA